MNLDGADLTSATLYAADLTRAVLPGAILHGADLASADFTDAMLTDARWPRDVPVPGGWELDTGTGRLTRVARSDSAPAEAN